MATVQYDAKTGKKLATGATTTDALGNTYKQGTTYAPTKVASGGDSGANLTPQTVKSPAVTPALTPAPLTPTTDKVAPAVPATTPTTAPTGYQAPTQDQMMQNLMGSKLSDVDKSKVAQNLGLSDVYKAKLEMAKSSGLESPTNGESGAITGQFQVADIKPDLTEMNAVIDNDPGMQQLLQMKKDYNDVMNQKTSLVEEYQNMIQDSGLEQINTDLINTKNIIDGTEDDIRTEITKAGGFATDSQVLAMSNARNKSLIKNYNNLLDTKQMIMENVNTMIGLAEKDRANAMSALNTKMNIDTQIIEYADKMKTNAVNSYQKIIDQVGYAGLAQMTQGDPYYTSLVEKTLGLGVGGLAGLASYVKPLTAMEQLDMDYKKAQIANVKADTAKTYADTPGISGTEPANPMQMAQTEQSITDVNSLLTNPAIRTAVGPTWMAKFTGRGLDVATGERQNFIAEVEKLRSQLSLDSLIRAKANGATFGALSDREMTILSASASKLGSWANQRKDGTVKSYSASEKAFKQELEKINNFAKLDYILKGGDPASVGVQVMTDGSYAVQNSDGSYTQLQ